MKAASEAGVSHLPSEARIEIVRETRVGRTASRGTAMINKFVAMGLGGPLRRPRAHGRSGPRAGRPGRSRSHRSDARARSRHQGIAQTPYPAPGARGGPQGKGLSPPSAQPGPRRYRGSEELIGQSRARGGRGRNGWGADCRGPLPTPIEFRRLWSLMNGLAGSTPSRPRPVKVGLIHPISFASCRHPSLCPAFAPRRGAKRIFCAAPLALLMGFVWPSRRRATRAF